MVFAELRNGQTMDGALKVKSPSTVLSTAELISTVTSSAILSSFFGGGQVDIGDGVASLLGTIAKEQRDDVGVFKEYLETVVKGRRDEPWPSLYRAAREQLG
ncbi:MAG: hypothetical protein KatS3mg059_0624 [Thermomicrobiales bacterium]|nr:MAG: hypothetical protein KatS3mg059_0624 [Thermomicrobiales bacterium]